MTIRVRIHVEDPISAIGSLEGYFRNGGVSIIQAAFTHTYFAHPDAVREKTPFFPDRARRSREHYPNLEKGARSTWRAGDGREVILDDNSRAQMAWERYTGHRLARRSGYGIRHIWGNTHNPEAFTAGWNLCYMPFWAGMLTEDQHPHDELQRAIRQASWDLFFAQNPVCERLDFVEDPGVDLGIALGGDPVRILSRGRGGEPSPRRRRSRESALPIDLEPPDPRDFLEALLRNKEAWIEESYRDGRREVRRWDAAGMKRTSKVIGNLRSRPEFRAGAWQDRGIVGVRVSIEPPSGGHR